MNIRFMVIGEVSGRDGESTKRSGGPTSDHGLKMPLVLAEGAIMQRMIWHETCIWCGASCERCYVRELFYTRSEARHTAYIGTKAMKIVSKTVDEARWKRLGVGKRRLGHAY